MTLPPAWTHESRKYVLSLRRVRKTIGTVFSSEQMTLCHSLLWSLAQVNPAKILWAVVKAGWIFLFPFFKYIWPFYNTIDHPSRHLSSIILTQNIDLLLAVLETSRFVRDHRLLFVYFSQIEDGSFKKFVTAVFVRLINLSMRLV